MIDMTVPKYMDNLDMEEATQEQLDWLKSKAEELRHYYYQIQPTLQTAWKLMSELQEVVDRDQDWTDELNVNSLDTAILHVYAFGTLELLEGVEALDEGE